MDSLKAPTMTKKELDQVLFIEGDDDKFYFRNFNCTYSVCCENILYKAVNDKVDSNQIMNLSVPKMLNQTHNFIVIPNKRSFVQYFLIEA